MAAGDSLAGDSFASVSGQSAGLAILEPVADEAVAEYDLALPW
jgi:hypothetical protein